MRVNCAFTGCPNTVDETELTQQTRFGFTPSFTGCCNEHILWGIQQSLERREKSIYEALDTITYNVEETKKLKELRERLPK